MHVTAYKSPVVSPGDDLFEVLRQTLPAQLPEQAVVAVSSKIVALSENRVVPLQTSNQDKNHKHDLVKQEAELYLDPTRSKYNVMLTVKNKLLAVNAGIDESNTGGFYVLWPQDCQAAVNSIWHWLRDTYGTKQLGVILTDSKTTPLFWGVTGASVAHCGFSALNDKRQTPDIFGHLMQMTQVNVAQALAAVAVLEMGETNEQTPVAVVTQIPEIAWHDHTPTPQELALLDISLEDDVYAPILTKADWKKGGDGK